MSDEHCAGMENAKRFPLLDAIFGRRSRRFAVGATIPDGPLAFASSREPLPLTQSERDLVLCAVAGNTGWHNLIMRHERYAPHLSNYSGSAGGRTFPSAAGFETSEIFFTDDTGVYMLATRDAPALVDRDQEGLSSLEELLEAHRPRLHKIREGRLHLPREDDYIEGHNTWIVNVPGSLLVIPVGDLAQHCILGLCYYLQNGYIITDDVSHRAIPGIEEYADLAMLDAPLPLTFFERTSLQELTTELSIACYSGALALQAMGLGGWMFNGVNPLSILGAGGDPEVPALGFRYDQRDDWPLPNPTGLSGFFEGHCPPHYPDMRAAVEAVVERKFGPGGPYSRDTPGPWKDTPGVRSSAQRHSSRFIDCVTLMAQYVFDEFGKFPGTVPSVLAHTYLQAHHLDTDFYDTYFQPGAYLRTHAEHLQKWHPDLESAG